MATLYAYSPNGTQATLPVNVMGFTQSLATNGWCKLPNGLIFQWISLIKIVIKDHLCNMIKEGDF